MNAPALLAQAQQLIRQKQPTAALEAFTRLTTHFPRYAEGWFQRSGFEVGRALGLTAIASARQALAVEPARALYRAHLAQVQFNYGLWGDALETLAPLRPLDPSTIEPRIANSVGSVLSLAGLEHEAQPWFDSASARALDSPTYAFNQAQGLLYTGDVEGSRAALAALTGRFPDFAKAHWALSSIRSGAADPQRPDTLYAALQRAQSPVDEVMYCYALFNTLDALDRTDDAFQELEHGMRLQRTRLNYDGEDTRALRGITAAVSADMPSIDDMPMATDGVCPIFVLGLPRSGTTLVERILGNHPDVATGGEMTCFSAALREQWKAEVVNPMLTSSPLQSLATPVSHARLAARYRELTAFKSDGRKFLSDKYPFNFMLVPWIVHAFPDARIVHLRRDPVDTCFGNLKQLFSGQYGACYSQQDMAAYYDAYRDMMARWDALYPARVHHVDYVDLVTDPERSAADLLAQCGLPAVADAWRIENNPRTVATASSAQVRQPINRKGLDAWRRYAEQLRPLANHFGAS
ncbi:sulfotransferase [Lysobacter sp. LF1]|uniref:Sulfotransferase n=1 Tax=Lysobacter stagni TaxID=3045172 RepID=A0ABT6XB15_9GAMM|nr:sulfotransferase [Lysobacter sp. LF1]MDI9237337.1 sulfotransferase [Lysobacter sp. LF1]